MPEDEALLIMSAQKGETAALEALLMAYEKRVYNIAYRFMENEADAYDMAQDSLIKIYKGIKSFKGESAFSSWVYRLTVNTCFDGLRKRQKAPVSLDYAMENGISVEGMSSDTPETRVLSFEKQEDIHRAIGTLSEEHKSVVILRDINGLSYEEISYSLGLSIGTVKSRLNRGRQHLKALLINL